MKRLIHAVLVLALVSLSCTAFAKNDKLPQGRPFQMLADKIDANYLELMENIGELFSTTQDHEERIAVCESTIASLQIDNIELADLIASNSEDIDGLEERIEINESKISILESYVNTLETAFASGCPAGSSIRSYTETGGIVCEDDDSGADNVSFRTVVEEVSSDILGSYSGVAVCPDGYSVTGGGYKDLGLLGNASLITVVHTNAPINYNKWKVHLEADYFHIFDIYARCLKIE